ncbi:MAG: alpha/beta fold hydrolase [Pseudomonadota bacterium]
MKGADVIMTKGTSTAAQGNAPMPDRQVSTQADSDWHRSLDHQTHAALAKLTGGLSPFPFVEAWADWFMHTARAPGRQIDLAEHAARNAAMLAEFTALMLSGHTVKLPFKPGPNDPRFNHDSWTRAPYVFWQQAFLATQDWWQYAARDLSGVRPQDAQRIGFLFQQMLDVFSPANFPLTNPEILEETRRCAGQNLAKGALHFWDDLVHLSTRQHRPPPDDFKIGERLATTPGKIVFRNELFELVQYIPQTARVHPEPILFVPAWIMKYYVLDLSEHNSLIAQLVREGFTVFVISWSNPTRKQADLSLEDYRKLGVMTALDAVQAICPGRKIHVNGYCLGGTILSIAAAAMARDGDDRLASITLMAAQVDFAEAGELLLFLDDSEVAFLEDVMWEQGFLDRPQMSGALAAIRSEDLIYARAIRRYFLGQEDLPHDLSVWTADTTRMPARMHSEYLRGLFLENRLTAGRFAVEGSVIVLKDITAPMFVIGTETDHIAPWRSVYKTSLFTDNDLTFVLTNGGHNGGILSEPGHPGRHYRLGHRPAGGTYRSPDDWLDAHEAERGSWWPAWVHWLKAQCSRRASPPGMGAPDLGYPVLGDAPGEYVHAQ